MGSKAVSDTGPIIHLSEICLLEAFNIFSEVFIPEEVEKELIQNNVLAPKKIKILKLLPEFKDKVKILADEEEIDLGEAFAIALSMQEKADYFLTDDLDARNAAIKYNIQVHGTIGILLRAFREKKITKKATIEKVNELYLNSSLFVTKDLIDEIIIAIEEFAK